MERRVALFLFRFLTKNAIEWKFVGTDCLISFYFFFYRRLQIEGTVRVPPTKSVRYQRRLDS